MSISYFRLMFLIRLGIVFLFSSETFEVVGISLLTDAQKEYTEEGVGQLQQESTRMDIEAERHEEAEEILSEGVQQLEIDLNDDKNQISMLESRGRVVHRRSIKPPADQPKPQPQDSSDPKKKDQKKDEKSKPNNGKKDEEPASSPTSAPASSTSSTSASSPLGTDAPVSKQKDGPSFCGIGTFHTSTGMMLFAFFMFLLCLFCCCFVFGVQAGKTYDPESGDENFSSSGEENQHSSPRNISKATQRSREASKNNGKNKNFHYNPEHTESNEFSSILRSMLEQKKKSERKKQRNEQRNEQTSNSRNLSNEEENSDKNENATNYEDNFHPPPTHFFHDGFSSTCTELDGPEMIMSHIETSSDSIPGSDNIPGIFRTNSENSENSFGHYSLNKSTEKISISQPRNLWPLESEHGSALSRDDSNDLDDPNSSNSWTL